MPLKIDDIEIDGLTPVEVMLDVMRFHYRAGVRAIVKTPRIGQQHLRRAAIVAATAAPYCHVRATTDGDHEKRVLEVLIEDAAADGGVKRITASS